MSEFPTTPPPSGQPMEYPYGYYPDHGYYPDYSSFPQAVPQQQQQQQQQSVPYGYSDDGYLYFYPPFAAHPYNYGQAWMPAMEGQSSQQEGCYFNHHYDVPNYGLSTPSMPVYNNNNNNNKGKRRRAENYCKLCKSNGESANVYKGHLLKNAKGEVTCPILFKYKCPYCGETGEKAHTIKYCPTQQPQEFSYRKALNSSGKLCTLKY